MHSTENFIKATLSLSDSSNQTYKCLARRVKGHAEEVLTPTAAVGNERSGAPYPAVYDSLREKRGPENLGEGVSRAFIALRLNACMRCCVFDNMCCLHLLSFQDLFRRLNNSPPPEVDSGALCGPVGKFSILRSVALSLMCMHNCSDKIN